MYVFHRAIGDDIEIRGGGGAAIKLRVVGALSHSVFQSELIVGEPSFVRLLPGNEGYRLFLVRPKTPRTPRTPRTRPALQTRAPNRWRARSKTGSPISASKRSPPSIGCVHISRSKTPISRRSRRSARSASCSARSASAPCCCETFSNGGARSWPATRMQTRYGCFLPDLTGLARHTSATNLPGELIARIHPRRATAELPQQYYRYNSATWPRQRAAAASDAAIADPALHDHLQALQRA